MNRMFFLCILIFSMCSAGSQNVPIKHFINSMEETSKEKLANFRTLLNEGKNMTQEQALQFVYQNDTSRLYCHFQEFNMETEEKGSLTKELYLPQTCLKLTSPKFILIGYSTFSCADPNTLLEMFLTLKVFDSKSLNVTDSLIVYQGNEYDWKMTGIINPQNRKIFIVKQLGNREFNANVFIYKINDNLRFEIEEKREGINSMPGDLEKAIQLLGWKDMFLND
jgi:hypothetical protein